MVKTISVLVAGFALGCTPEPVGPNKNGEGNGNGNGNVVTVENGSSSSAASSSTTSSAATITPDAAPSTPDAGTAGQAPVTFVLKNTAKEDLTLSLDKGWQPVIFAYSGKPPKATPIIMFPKFCSKSCDTSPQTICPHCPEPDKVADIKKAEKRQVIPGGTAFEVRWDGMHHQYRKTRATAGKKRNCECFEKVDAPPETYTVTACGFRVTKTARARSKYQCVRAEMTLPSETPQTVTLTFPKVK